MRDKTQIPRPDEFIKLIHQSGQKDETGNDKETGLQIQFGNVDAAYTSGKPAILFDNADVVSAKKYPYIGTLAASDRVIVINGVAIGPIKLT